MGLHLHGLSILDMDHPVCHGGDGLIMCDDDHRHSLFPARLLQ